MLLWDMCYTELWLHQQVLGILHQSHPLNQTTLRHPHTHQLPVSTTIFPLDLCNTLKKVACSHYHHLTPFSSQQPEWSSKGMNQTMSHPRLSNGFRVKFQLLTVAHNALHDLASIYLPLSLPGTLAFLLFLELVQFSSTSKSLLILGTV